MTDEFGGSRIEIRLDPATRRVDARDALGNELTVIPAFWFAWMAFYPDSSVFTSSRM